MTRASILVRRCLEKALSKGQHTYSAVSVRDRYQGMRLLWSMSQIELRIPVALSQHHTSCGSRTTCATTRKAKNTADPRPGQPGSGGEWCLWTRDESEG